MALSLPGPAKMLALCCRIESVDFPGDACIDVWMVLFLFCLGYNDSSHRMFNWQMKKEVAYCL